MWFVLILVILAIGMMCFVWWRMKRRRLSGEGRKKVLSAWMRVEEIKDPVKKIIEADNVLALALQECGYQGSLGEKLKAAGARMRNIDDVWQAHKLRNRIAHEAGIRVSDEEAGYATRAIGKAIDSL